MSQRSSADLAHEREVLEDMLRSEGWQVFVRRCALEWRGDGYFARMGQAVESDDPVATKVLHRVSIEIERAIQWPADRVKTLKGHTE